MYSERGNNGGSRHHVVGLRLVFVGAAGAQKLRPRRAAVFPFHFVVETAVCEGYDGAFLDRWRRPELSARAAARFVFRRGRAALAIDGIFHHTDDFLAAHSAPLAVASFSFSAAFVFFSPLFTSISLVRARGRSAAGLSDGVVPPHIGSKRVKAAVSPPARKST